MDTEMRGIILAPESSVAPILSHLVLKHTLEDCPKATLSPPPVIHPSLLLCVPGHQSCPFNTAQALPSAGEDPAPNPYFCQVPGPGLLLPHRAQEEVATCQRRQSKAAI